MDYYSVDTQANWLATEVVTPPAMEPLTLSEAKKQLEIAVSDTTHDEQLQRAIQEAREQWERDTDDVCCYTTFKIQTDHLGIQNILPKKPVVDITSITYYDPGNVLRTMGTDNYQLHIPKRVLRLAYLRRWPVAAPRWDAFTITYRCGYSADGTLVPAIAKRAMLLLIGYYFENRDMLIDEQRFNMAAYEKLVKRFVRSTYP